MKYREKIIAEATPPGRGAISVFRLSGEGIIEVCDRFFRSVSGKSLKDAPGYSLHYGEFTDGSEVIDEVMVAVFRAPKSYTGEDAVEISVHASPYIRRRVVEVFLQAGVRLAEPGEFTLRAFLNGKMDLTRAEAVADLIDAESKWEHDAAFRQLRGGFSSVLKNLRAKLVEFASLMELELDFSEEDVEFADRKRFDRLLKDISRVLSGLISSYETGNILKKGLPVAIVGEPNAGKSTLLNLLLREEKAIVTDVPGTTRDAIEDEVILGGVKFRFVDTAGLRETADKVEKIGIERTYEKMREARIILVTVDVRELKDISGLLLKIRKWKADFPDKIFAVILNKTDLIDEPEATDLAQRLHEETGLEIIPFSAKTGKGLSALEAFLTAQVDLGRVRSGDLVVMRARHTDALRKALAAVENVREGLQAGISTDLLAVDIREALHYLGEITGEISTDDLLDHIFRNFCIGK